MNEHERDLFNGRCPYTDEECNKDIECLKCPLEEKERKLYEDEKEETK